MKKFYFKTLLATLLLLCSTVVTAQTLNDWTSTNTAHGSTSSYTYYLDSDCKKITFDWSVSSESGFDWLIVTIDGTEVLRKSGSASGTYTHTFTTTSSSHTLAVKYTKDNSNSLGSDQARIYNIKYTVGGKCGENVTWLLSDGTLTIEGTGAMQDYGLGEEDAVRPWYRYYYITNIIIKNSVTTIGNYAFYKCSNLTSVTIPNSVTTIGACAFYECAGLTSVTIPNSVTTIENDAFSCCYNVTSIVVDSGNTKYDSRNNCNAIIETATNTLIKGCKNTCIPNSVTSIGYNAFSNIGGLKNITIPNSVTTIGNSAFGNTGLTSVTIGSGVRTIGNNAFEECDNLTAVHITDLTAWCNIDFIYNYSGYYSNPLYYAKNLYLNGKLITSLVIPDGVTEIKRNTFENCNKITSITIPNSVTTIGSSAFYNCTSLTAVYITDLTAWCNLDFGYHNYNPLYYAKNLYLNGELLTNLVIPNEITNIKNYAFYNCSNLTKVTIPNSVTSIGNSAFYSCTNLKIVYNNSSLNITNGSSNHGYVAYYANTIVTPDDDIQNNFIFRTTDDKHILIGYTGSDSTITLPENFNNHIYTIGSYAFSGSSSLTSIIIPESVEEIAADAFKGCTSLTEIYSMAEVPAVIEETSFPNYSATLYVPAGAKRLYKITTGWSNFTNIVEMEPTEEPEVERLEGDVDGDGSVDIADITRLVEIILNGK